MKKSKKKITLSLIVLLILALVGVLIGMYIFRSYDVVYDSKGGSNIKAESVIVGRSANKPVDPVMQGYIFKGWYVGDELYNFDSEITEDITLVAKWESIVEKVQ